MVKKKKNKGYAKLEIDGNEGNISQETKGPEVWVSEWNFANEKGLTVLKVSTKKLKMCRSKKRYESRLTKS